MRNYLSIASIYYHHISVSLWTNWKCVSALLLDIVVGDGIDGKLWPLTILIRYHSVNANEFKCIIHTFGFVRIILFICRLASGPRTASQLFRILSVVCGKAMCRICNQDRQRLAYGRSTNERSVTSIHEMRWRGDTPTTQRNAYSDV